MAPPSERTITCAEIGRIIADEFLRDVEGAFGELNKECVYTVKPDRKQAFSFLLYVHWFSVLEITRTDFFKERIGSDFAETIYKSSLIHALAHQDYLEMDDVSVGVARFDQGLQTIFKEFVERGGEHDLAFFVHLNAHFEKACGLSGVGGNVEFVMLRINTRKITLHDTLEEISKDYEIIKY